MYLLHPHVPSCVRLPDIPVYRGQSPNWYLCPRLKCVSEMSPDFHKSPDYLCFKELILQAFHHFTYVAAHSPTLLPLYLHHISFSNPSIALPTSQLILQASHFTYVIAHSPTLPLLYLRHSSFSKLSTTSPTSQLILQPFCHFMYIIAHSPALLLLHLHYSSFSNPSFASPTSQTLH